MRVLMVNTTTYTMNGIANVITTTVEKMKEIDSSIMFDVTSHTVFDEANKEKLMGKARIINVPARKKIFSYAKALKKLAKEYDVIHVHGNSYSMILELFAFRKHLNKVITHGHAASSSHPLIHKILKRVLSKFSKNRVACSDDAGKFLYSNKYSVLENGVDINQFRFSSIDRELLRNEYFLNEKKVFLHIGTFSPQKNQEFLLNVIRTLDIKNEYFVFIGNGKEKKRLQESITDDEKKYIKFMEPKKDVWRYYSMADIFVLPSIHESFGLVLLEAQINGLHSIVSDGISRASLVKEQQVTYLPLDENIWAEALSNAPTYEREKFIEKDFLSFSTDNTIKKVYDYYLSISKTTRGI